MYVCVSLCVQTGWVCLCMFRQRTSLCVCVCVCAHHFHYHQNCHGKPLQHMCFLELKVANTVAQVIANFVLVVWAALLRRTSWEHICHFVFFAWPSSPTFQTQFPLSFAFIFSWCSFLSPVSFFHSSPALLACMLQPLRSDLVSYVPYQHCARARLDARQHRQQQVHCLLYACEKFVCLCVCVIVFFFFF